VRRNWSKEVSITQLQPDEVVRRGESLYEERVRPEVEPEHNGKFLVLNVLTGEYEMDIDDLAASRRAKERFKDAPLFALRIGHATAYRLGGPLRVSNS
jgi:hypothetical protein